MNKKEFDEYCLSLGLVQTNSGDFWYGYNYPFKYARPRDNLSYGNGGIDGNN